ncbi:hypothetical protein PF011_g12098 [Phytophthora fragariae]|uniref:RNA-directed DNA polymerase n=2 Tax=Phytophthora fragariae TaxID=53985 RepID=A0A6A3KDB1_9STRA|nr:hypothetical protein PF011_g12098 [Phytophthora fragariae]
MCPPCGPPWRHYGFVRPDRKPADDSTVAGRVVTRMDEGTTGVIEVTSTKEDGTRLPSNPGTTEEEHRTGDDTTSLDVSQAEEGDVAVVDEVQTEEGDVAAPVEAEEGDATSLNEVPTTGGDTPPRDEMPAEEGVATASQVTSSQGVYPGDGRLEAKQSSVLDSVDQVRLATRRTKEEAKRRRVERATRKSIRKATEVERTVTALNDERRTRRRRQANAARVELAQRQQVGQTVSSGSASAKVSLVQRTPASTVANKPGSTSIAADDGLPTASMMVDEERVAIKLDSGARYSVAGTDWMQRGERLRKDAPVECVKGIGGFRLNVLGVWAFTMRNAYGQVVELEACIIEGCADEFLVGVDFLRQHRASMDFNCNEVKYFDHGKLIIIPFRTEDDEGGAKVAVVRVVKQSRLVRSAVTPVEVMVTAPDGEEGIFVPTRWCGTVMLAATVTTARGGKAWVPAINVHGGKTKLPAKKELGTWIPTAAGMHLLELSGELERGKVAEWIATLGDEETPLDNEDEVHMGTKDPDSQQLVLKLLRAYRKVLEDAGDCPPVTALDVEHHIDTGNAKPIMLKRRRHAQFEDAIMEDNVSRMLQAGVIEEGNGAWGFPVVLVRKKDGEVRFCVDYRALNKITKRDVYPLPRIDETLEALGGARLFTTLDLKAGYWQISVAAEDRDKTAFTTKQGIYRFIRMPFGLMNAPSTFQRMMNGVLRGLTWSTCLVNLDDIVVYTRGGIERHIIELATVLERLSAAGLTLKLKKCVFAAASMEYLGHELSSEGVRPVERPVTEVREFPRSRDPTEVKRFVHLAGYYRKFIEAFGSIMAPLTRLLKKSSEWEWTEEQKFAFERVKAALATRPLLVYLNFELPFRLVTDTSKTGLGTCLMQDQGRGWQPVAFASKVNSSAEANYSITELECLAVVWSVKLFRPYLYGRAFTIITDHSALKWLMTRPNLADRLHRWSLTLQEYEFEILYRPGATNIVADALSRASATVMAAVGRKRKQCRAGDQPWRAVGIETEEKTEEGLLPTSAAVREAEEHARRTAGQPVAAVVSDWAAEVPATARPSTSTASPSSVYF